MDDARGTRLPGSGTVPRVFALVLLAAALIFVAVWASMRPDSLLTPLPYLVVALAAAAAIRSLVVGVYLVPGAVLVRGWFTTLRYGRGELGAIQAIPYWRFLDPKDPVLALLKFTPVQGWVREVSATVSWKDRAAAHAVAVRRHLEIGEPRS